MPTPMTLDQIFGAFVNQTTLEEAADWMADVSASDPNLFTQIQTCLNEGMRLGAEGDLKVVHAVHRSGYRVSTPNEAGDYCSELLTLFMKASNGPA